MRYFVLLGASSEAVPVEVEPLGRGRYALTVGGRRQEVDAQSLPQGDLSLLVDGASHTVELETRPDGLRASVGGELFHLRVVDERHQARGSLSVAGGLEGPEVVRSPMPGKVVKLLVAQGDEVREGQGLVVVEAMKMENELRSPRSGRVVRIAVMEGAAVEGHAELVIIESTSAPLPAR
jgi:biotin carboxyl carrier protein